MSAPYYDPTLYDAAMAGSCRDDVDWYRRKARECGGPILELGAGTGRITIPIAQDGVLIHALDCHPGMLNALRRNVSELPVDVRQRIVVTEGDMRSFRLDQDFALVIIPFRAFLENVTPDEQLACLRCVREHLRPGATLAFDVFHPSLQQMARDTGALEGVWRWYGTYPLPSGEVVIRSEANRYDTVRQHVHTQHKYEYYSDEGTLTRTVLQQIKMAYLHAGDIRHILAHAGFEAIRVFGDFAGRAFENDTDELVVEARRA